MQSKVRQCTPQWWWALFHLFSPTSSCDHIHSEAQAGRLTPRFAALLVTFFPNLGCWSVQKKITQLWLQLLWSPRVPILSISQLRSWMKMMGWTRKMRTLRVVSGARRVVKKRCVYVGIWWQVLAEILLHSNHRSILPTMKRLKTVGSFMSGGHAWSRLVQAPSVLLIPTQKLISLLAMITLMAGH